MVPMGGWVQAGDARTTHGCYVAMCASKTHILCLQTIARVNFVDAHVLRSFIAI